MTKSLLQLPTELVLQVVSHLSDDRRALCRLAQTCKTLQPICEEHIYTIIELLSTDDLHDILHAFARRPARVDTVHTLKILYKFTDALGATVQERHAFNKQVKKMGALRDLHIESPYDNGKWDEGGADWVNGDMVDFRRAIEAACLHHGEPLNEEVGLAKLQKFILHSHGTETDYWDLGGYHCLFRHPSLRDLHVSCVDLTGSLDALDPYVSATPLSTLVFDECEIAPRSLLKILRTPKSIKNLTLGENVHYIREGHSVQPRLSANPEATMEALSTVSHSLEFLRHYDPLSININDRRDLPVMKLKSPGMRHFHRLTVLECDLASFLYQGILKNSNLVPPNLSTIRIHAYENHIDTFFEDLPDTEIYLAMPSLKEVEFVQPMDTVSTFAMANHVCYDEEVQARHTKCYALWQKGICVRIYAELQRFTGRGYQPPYLHGEDVPQQICLYDSFEIGFLRVVEEDTPPSSPTIKHEEDDTATQTVEDKPDPKTHYTDQLSESDILTYRHSIRRKYADFCKAILNATGRTPSFGQPTFNDSEAEDSWETDSEGSEFHDYDMYLDQLIEQDESEEELENELLQWVGQSLEEEEMAIAAGLEGEDDEID